MGNDHFSCDDCDGYGKEKKFNKLAKWMNLLLFVSIPMIASLAITFVLPDKPANVNTFTDVCDRLTYVPNDNGQSSFNAQSFNNIRCDDNWTFDAMNPNEWTEIGANDWVFRHSVSVPQNDDLKD